MPKPSVLIVNNRLRPTERPSFAQALGFISVIKQLSYEETEPESVVLKRSLAEVRWMQLP
jgi:hypothetical protein